MNNAKEAYCYMTYQCDKCRRKEVIFNLRGEVTPFSLGCCDCDGMMSHIDWNRDRFMGKNHTPDEGTMVFINLTIERAYERAKRRVESTKGTKFELHGDEKEEMVESLATSYMEDCCSVDVAIIKIGNKISFDYIG